MANFSINDYVDGLSRRLRNSYGDYGGGETVARSVTQSAYEPTFEPAPLSLAKGESSYREPSWIERNTHPQSFLGRTIDVISRPIYAVGEVMRQGADAGKAMAGQEVDNPNVQQIQNATNPFSVANAIFNMTTGAAASGLAGRSKTLPSEVVLQNWKDTGDGFNFGRFAAGLGIDIATDPLTYVPVVGLGSMAAKAGGRGIFAAQKGLSGIDEAADVVEATSRQIPKQITAAGEGRHFSVDAAGEAVEKGTWVPPINRETSAFTELNKTGSDIVSERAWQTMLQNPAGGRVPYKPGLENLKTQRRVYARDLKIEAPFKEIRVKGGKKTPTGTQGIGGFLKNVQQKSMPTTAEVQIKWGKETLRATMPIKAADTTVDDWAKANARAKVPHPTKTDELITLAQLRKGAENGVTKFPAALRAYYRSAQTAAEEIAATASKMDAAAAADAPGAAQRAAQRGAPTYGKMTGKALEEWQALYGQVLRSEDIAKILEATSKEAADVAIKEVLGRKTKYPIYSRVFAPIDSETRIVTPEIERIARYPRNEGGSVLDEAIAGVPDVPQRMAQAETTPVAMSQRAAVTETVKSGQALDSDVREILLEAAGKQQQWGGRQADYKFTTDKTQAVTTTAGFRDPGSLAVHIESWNMMSQMNTLAALTRRASQMPDLKKLKGTARRRAVMNYVMPRLKQVDDFMRANGVEPALTQQRQGYPLSLYDVLDAIRQGKTPMTGKRGKQLAEGNTGEAFLLSRVFDARGADPATRKIVGHEGTIDADSLQLAAQSILDELFGAPAVSSAKGIEKQIAAALKVPSEATEQRLVKTIAGNRTPGKQVKGKGRVPVSESEAKFVVGDTVDALLHKETIRAMFEAVARNSAARGIRVGDETARLTETKIKEVMGILSDPNASHGQLVQSVTRTNDDIDDLARGMDALPESADVAKQMTAEEMTRTLDPSDMKQIDSHAALLAEQQRIAANMANSGRKASDIAKAISPSRIKHSQKMHNDAAAEGLRTLPAEQILDMGDTTAMAMTSSITRKFFPVGSKRHEFMSKVGESFVAHYGHATLHPAWVTTNTLGRQLMVPWLENLNALSAIAKKSGDAEMLPGLMKMLQSGRAVDGVPEAMREAYAPMHNLMTQLFEDGPNSVLGAFFRNGFDIDHVNEAFHRAGLRATSSKNQTTRAIDEYAYFDVEKAFREAGDRNPMEVLANQWREWDIKDPLDFLAQARQAMHIVSVESGVVQEAVRIASSKGYLSKKPKAGFVKAGFDDDGVFSKYFPQGTYVHKDIAPEFAQMNKIMKESRVLTSDFGRWVNGNFLPAQNMWKTGMTIVRPGHHMRNLVGDLSLVGLAEGFKALNPAYTQRALRMMGMRGRYDGWDYLKALQGEEFSIAGKAPQRVNPIANNEVVAKIKVNGKEVGITAEQMHVGLMKGGVFPEFRHLEDLLESVSGTKIANLEKSVQQSKAINIAGRLSEARDDYVRIMHAMVYLENRTHRHKFKSVDEALEAAAAQVRKWHPDGSDLSAFEARQMRTFFPFYSWSRKAIPLVVESLLMNPARVMVWPKATYHMAEANGIDLETFADPFPTDQLFPSFLTDMPTGPITRTEDGSYLGFNPGIASMDVMREFLGDPWRGAMGNLTPGIKAPIEAATRTSLSTGAKIHDIGEYIDSQLPLVTSLAGTTGYSVSGSVASLLGAGDLDPQRQVEKGNKDYFDRTSFINYLFGVGIIDMSKDSYINIAEMEARDKAGRELRKIRGY